MTLIPLYNDNKLIGTVTFTDNLTLSTEPDYVNQNGQIGLKRLDKTYGKYENMICFMFYDPKNPHTSYAEMVTEREAYIMCLNHGKLELASELKLDFIENMDVEVI